MSKHTEGYHTYACEECEYGNSPDPCLLQADDDHLPVQCPYPGPVKPEWREIE